MYKGARRSTSWGRGLLAENYIAVYELKIGVGTITRIDKYVNACNPAKFAASIKNHTIKGS